MLNNKMIIKDVKDVLKTTEEFLNYYSEFNRDVKIVKLIWNKDETFETLGEEYGLTRERIRQLYKRGMLRVKKYIRISFEEYKKMNDIKSENEKLKKENTYLRQSAKEELIDITVEGYNMKPCDVDWFSVRTLNVLRNAEIKVLGDLTKLRKNDLFGYRNFGKKSMIEVVDVMEEYGLKFKPNTKQL
jgi:hypothetical protein